MSNWLLSSTSSGSARATNGLAHGRCCWRRPFRHTDASARWRGGWTIAYAAAKDPGRPARGSRSSVKQALESFRLQVVDSLGCFLHCAIAPTRTDPPRRAARAEWAGAQQHQRPAKRASLPSARASWQACIDRCDIDSFADTLAAPPRAKISKARRANRIAVEAVSLSTSGSKDTSKHTSKSNAEPFFAPKSHKPNLLSHQHTPTKPRHASGSNKGSPRMRRLLALPLTAAATPTRATSSSPIGATRPSRARGVYDASRRMRTSPSCPAAATLRDVGPSLQVFDVVIRAEKAFPDLDVHDSQGFRLQKLREASRRPTSARSSSTATRGACKDPGATLFPLLREHRRGLRLGRPRQPLRRVGRRFGVRQNALERALAPLGGQIPHGHATDAPRAAFFSSGRAQGERRRSKGGETPDDLQWAQRAPL